MDNHFALLFISIVNVYGVYSLLQNSPVLKVVFTRLRKWDHVGPRLGFMGEASLGATLVI